MSFQTIIAGRSDGVFWWFPAAALSEDQEHNIVEFTTTEQCARQNDVNATRRSAGNSSVCQAHAFQSGHLYFNSSPIHHLFDFFRRNFIASQILSSKIISWNFICNAKGIFKSWECYRSRPFAGNKHARSHCQFSCQARTFTSFCRAHDYLVALRLQQSEN